MVDELYADASVPQWLGLLNHGSFLILFYFYLSPPVLLEENVTTNQYKIVLSDYLVAEIKQFSPYGSGIFLDVNFHIQGEQEVTDKVLTNYVNYYSGIWTKGGFKTDIIRNL